MEVDSIEIDVFELERVMAARRWEYLVEWDGVLATEINIPSSETWDWLNIWGPWAASTVWSADRPFLDDG